jgi:hypothetical protein
MGGGTDYGGTVCGYGPGKTVIMGATAWGDWPLSAWEDCGYGGHSVLYVCIISCMQLCG